MDSSSDGSFAWTDASNDSTSSEIMAKESMNEAHSEDESVSGKVYKKQLQEELFARSIGGLPNGEHKHKKRKHNVTEEQSDSEHGPRKKRIKREPESDVDAASPKCNPGQARHNEHNSSYDESYLNLKVKAEGHQFVAPSPTKKKNKIKMMCDSIDENKLSLHTSEESYKSKDNLSEEMELDEDNLNSLVLEEENCIKKKVKKKKKKSKNREDEVFSESKETSTTCTRTPFAPGDTPTASAESDVSSQGDTLDKSVITKRRKRSSNSTIIEQGKLGQSGTPLNGNVSFTVLGDSPKRQTRLLERLQFEDDSLDLGDMGNGQVQGTIAPASKSSKIKSFLSNNLNLKAVSSQLHDDAMLTDDDELWIIRCPKEVNVGAFLNKHLIPQGKCKLKLDGQTYEGVMDQEIGNISILTSERSGFLIQNLPVKGYLNLRKRIPKSLTQVDAIAHSLTSFIPLPDTKCRHPLFGSNYRKAIKLRSSVAEHLKQAGSTTVPDPHLGLAKKKRKTNKARQDSCHQLISSLKAEPTPHSPVKPELKRDHSHSHSPHNKNKKTKHSDNAQISSKTFKGTKHDLESAEAWESEQAIEENLFNF